ncbi:MAG: GTPase ObgE [Fimbriimonadaceae bacterium]|nr:GTPase ObgE [Fimbriimonadaceae bacterium]
MFLDEAIVTFSSGRGGSGAVAFHTEKHVPRGGPNGADGGRGGDVILLADRGRRTLYDFRLLDHYEADSGVHGLGNKRGKDAKDITIRVPVGTVVTDADTGELLVDFTKHGMSFIIAKGGRGGHGNMHYVNSVRQAPNFAEKGGPSEKVKVKLELKLLADVGIIGMPNAGKSTLISRISAAKPKIADYPFTTIVPNLGVVQFRDTSFTVADMPGLIEGASQGIGLGHQFLKHVERTRVLIHVIDIFPIDESDPWSNYELIENEIRLYSPEIAARPRLIAINKIDLLPESEIAERIVKFQATGYPVFPISGVTGQGLNDLLNTLTDIVEASTPTEEIPVIMPALAKQGEDYWEVIEEEYGYRVVGKRLERMIAMTDLESRDAVRYLQRRLERIGVIEKLRKAGIEEGDSVSIGEFEFDFTDEK